jgi:hypothetical protein
MLGVMNVGDAGLGGWSNFGWPGGRDAAALAVAVTLGAALGVIASAFDWWPWQLSVIAAVATLTADRLLVQASKRGKKRRTKKKGQKGRAPAPSTQGPSRRRRLRAQTRRELAFASGPPSQGPQPQWKRLAFGFLFGLSVFHTLISGFNDFADFFLRLEDLFS